MTVAQWRFKCILIGEPAVGKTSLMHQFVAEKFAKNYAMTIGCGFMTKYITSENKNVKLTIWDIGGQRRFLNIRSTFYLGANGALLVFDLTRQGSFDGVSVWLNEMNDTLGYKVPFILIGNKLDKIKKKGRILNANEARLFAQQHGSLYIETSAKTGENVEQAFRDLAGLMEQNAGNIPAKKIF